MLLDERGKGCLVAASDPADEGGFLLIGASGHPELLLPTLTRSSAPLTAALAFAPLLSHQLSKGFVLGIGQDLPDLAHALATVPHVLAALPLTPLPVRMAPLAVLGAKLLHPRPTLLGGKLAQLRTQLPHPLAHLRGHLGPLPLTAGALTDAFTAPLSTRLAVCLALIRASCGQLLQLRALLGRQLERVGV